jgi:hypothetical protein
MADVFLRSPRRKQVFIALHPAEAKDTLAQLIDEFTDAELTQLETTINNERERRRENEPQ